MASFNQLMDRLPLDVTENIYKLAHKDLFASIPTGYFYFYVNIGLSRNPEELHKCKAYSKSYEFKTIYNYFVMNINRNPMTFFYIDLCFRLVLLNQHFSNHHFYKILIAALRDLQPSIHIKQRTTIEVLYNRLMEKNIRIWNIIKRRSESDWIAFN